jgi:hypothetical protein
MYRDLHREKARGEEKGKKKTNDRQRVFEQSPTNYITHMRTREETHPRRRNE